MHGRVKTSVQPSVEQLAAKRAQIGKYVAAKELFVQRRQARLMDARTAELTAKLVELNPDFYTLWALRKEMLLSNIAAQSAQRATHSRAQTDCCDVSVRPPDAHSAACVTCRLVRCQARPHGRVVLS